MFYIANEEYLHGSIQLKKKGECAPFLNVNDEHNFLMLR